LFGGARLARLHDPSEIHFLVPFDPPSLASNRMKRFRLWLASWFLAASVLSAAAQPVVTPDLPVMSLDVLGVYAVGYAYRGQLEQQFLLGWSGFFERPFSCIVPGVMAPASPSSSSPSACRPRRRISSCAALRRFAPST
jgi:hypothetical protein